MKNFRFEIQNNELIIRVRLDQEHGVSKSGRSVIVSSSEGNLRLFDQNGFRPEIINMTVTKRASEASDS